MVDPSIFTNTAVERATNKRDFLVKTCLVVPSAHSQWNAFCGDKVVDVGGIGAVLNHFNERFSKIGCELIPVDGLLCRSALILENKHPFGTNVSCGHKGPTNGSARLGIIVNQHGYIAVVVH